MLIKKSQANKKVISEVCSEWEYDFQSEDISFATAYIDGRFPDKGKVANTGCEEIYYVLSGSGTIHTEFGDFNIEEGDLYHLKRGEKYWSEGKHLKLILVNSPKWSSEQLKQVE